MSDPERSHTTEPAEGTDSPGEDTDPGGRTPHPEEPAEGAPRDTPDGERPPPA